jgi:hypothetical protein
MLTPRVVLFWLAAASTPMLLQIRNSVHLFIDGCCCFVSSNHFSAPIVCREREFTTARWLLMVSSASL